VYINREDLTQAVPELLLLLMLIVNGVQPAVFFQVDYLVHHFTCLLVIALVGLVWLSRSKSCACCKEESGINIPSVGKVCMYYLSEVDPKNISSQ
jgi:hypothetical protein